MSAMSYLNVIERYHEYREALYELLASTLSGITEKSIITQKSVQIEAMHCLGKIYPFVDLLYVLDSEGFQVSDNIAKTGEHAAAYKGKGSDRSQRPYYKLAKNSEEIIVTEPYLSSVHKDLSVSAAIKMKGIEDDEDYYLILDINLGETIEFLMGDTARRKLMPVFKVVYSVIVAGLFCVVLALLAYAGMEFISLFQETDSKELQLKPFGIVIFLTLALAIFDLGKTTLEEEVLMYKDIFRHSSTRRTITRFIAAILIAVTIEALLLMFKSALGYGNDIMEAVLMMITGVGLLIGLGLYVYLGAKAENLLLKNRA